MKKLLLLALCVVLLVCACGAKGEVPDDALHEAILTLVWPDDGGECWVEGHVVLGREAAEGAETVYAQVFVQNYGFMAGIFIDTGGGFLMPLRLTFDSTENGWELREITQPEDGERYEPSLREMMPAECLRALQTNDAANRAEMRRQMYVQARAYLDSMGRTETVGDWRDKDLQTADMLIAASNLLLCFAPPYPLWVTDTQRLENGERFVYTRAWTPDADSPDGFVYALPNGNTMRCGGRTGVETLTRTRWADGETLETITARVEQYALTVTFADAFGEKEYSFVFDGETYRRPTVTERDACRAAWPPFDAACANLPE